MLKAKIHNEDRTCEYLCSKELNNHPFEANTTDNARRHRNTQTGDFKMLLLVQDRAVDIKPVKR